MTAIESRPQTVPAYPQTEQDLRQQGQEPGPTGPTTERNPPALRNCPNEMRENYGGSGSDTLEGRPAKPEHREQHRRTPPAGLQPRRAGGISI